MKRLNLFIGTMLGILLAIIIMVLFNPLLWLLGANKVYNKTHRFLNALIFDIEY